MLWWPGGTQVGNRRSSAVTHVTEEPLQQRTTRRQRTKDVTFINVVCCKLKGGGTRHRQATEMFPNFLILPATLGPGACSASNRNGYQQMIACLYGVERCRPLRLTALPPSVVQTMRGSSTCSRLRLFTFRDVRPQVCEAPLDAGVDVGVRPVAGQYVSR